MDGLSWKRVLDLTMSNPELLMAFLWGLGLLWILLFAAAAIGWRIKSAIARGERAGLDQRLKLASTLQQEAERKLAKFREEHAKVLQLIGKTTEPLNIAIMSAALSLTEATASSTAVGYALTAPQNLGRKSRP